jgi:CheY-like chemotaxis protein
VEDDDPTYFLVQTAIDEADLPLKLIRVADGEDALMFLAHRGAYAGSPRPDLVLLDLNLPRVSGFEVLLRVKSELALTSIPFLVVTNSCAVSDRERSMRLGARAFYTKPNSFDGLMELMRDIFRKQTEQEWGDLAPMA